MSSAIDQLPEAPAPYPFETEAPVVSLSAGAVVHLHQALSSYPAVRGTGLELTEALAEFALANNRSLPAEPARAVRLKIRSDGEGIRFVKRRRGDGWELGFHALEVGFSDIVEHRPAGDDGPQHWRVAINNTDHVLAWSGSWDDRPDVPGLWIGPPWLRTSIEGAQSAAGA